MHLRYRDIITKGRRANVGKLGICQQWYNIEGEAVMRKLSLIMIPLAILLLIILPLVFATGGGGAPEPSLEPATPDSTRTPPPGMITPTDFSGAGTLENKGPEPPPGFTDAMEAAKKKYGIDPWE